MTYIAKHHGSWLGFASHLTMTAVGYRHPEVPAKRATKETT